MGCVHAVTSQQVDGHVLARGFHHALFNQRLRVPVGSGTTICIV
jgi:hypothetical protein